MRNILIISFLPILQVLATNSYSQHATLSFDLKEASVDEVLNNIEGQSEFFFLCNKNLVDLNRKVSISVKDIHIEDALKQIFAGTDVECVILDRQVVLSKKEYISEVKRSLQQKTVTGKVTGADTGESLAGVSIILKGTTVGAVTDSDGNYKIEVPGDDATLVFSFVGMLTKEIQVGDRTVIDISLQPDIIGLEEVVAIGYGTIKRNDLTGSISSIDEEVITQLPVNSPDLLLRGQVAGVNVRMTTAEPGAPVTIRIRGTGSITSSNDPLYVIDGIPIGTGGLQTINPNDVVSVDVLKDASATAIYGARGANGVIIINTRTGNYGEKIRFNYSGYYGIQEVSRKYPMMNRDEIIEYARASNDNANYETGKNVYFPEEVPNSAYPDIDYQDLIFQKAPVQSHQLSATGGGENIKYYVSGNYFSQEGVVKYSKWDRYSFKTNLEARLSPKLKLGNFITYTYSDHDRSWTHTTDFWTGNNVVGQALMAYPFEPVKDDDGTYRYNNEMTVPLLQNRGRPIPDVEGIRNNFKTSRLLANLYLDYELVKGLRFRTSLATDERNVDQNKYHDKISQRGRLDNGNAYVNNSNRMLILNENTVNWTRNIDGIHDFNVLGGATFQVINSSSYNSTVEGFVNDAVETYAMDSGTEYSAPYHGKTKSSLASFLGRINYKFLDKYLLTFTARADGSSKFGPNNKWGFFPSGAASWRIDQESFMQNQNFVSTLKARISYGVTGNQEIGSYRSLSRLGVGVYPINESAANILYPNSFANEDLKWETTSQLNVGIDLGVIENRFNLTLDLYNKKTTDLLMSVELPFSSGFNSTLQNTGAVVNKGIELALNAIVFNQEFQWDIRGNFHLNRNEIVEIGLAQPFYVSLPSSLPWVKSPLIDEGISLGAFQGWKQDGLFRDQADVDAWLETMNPDVVNDIKCYPGYPKIIDVNGDGRIDSEDITEIGDPYPDFEFGLSNWFSYKNFDLNFFFQGMIGHDICNVINGQTIGFCFVRYNEQKRVVGNYWTEENPDARYIKPAENIKASRPQIGTDFTLIEDGTFVRLKNVSLGYSFRGIRFIEKLRIFFNVINAYTFTNYYGYDPEVNDHGEQGGSLGVNWGIDMSSYPQSRTYTFGVDMTF